MKHESGLPFAIDRSIGKDEQQSVVFYGQRPFLQSGELNEVQTIIRGRHNRLGRLVAKEGDRVERADAFVNKDTQTVTLTDGKIFIAGDIFPISPTVLNNVSMIGRVEIGVKLQKSWNTHEDDPELLGQIPGTLAEGEPGAAREIAKLVWALKDDGQQGTFFPVYILQDGVLIDQKSPSLLEPAMQAIATYDRAHGHYIVSGCRVSALGSNNSCQIFSIQEGEANINGFKRKRLAALRHEEPEDFSTSVVPSETHIFAPQKGKKSFTFKSYYSPIADIQSLLLTKEKTVNITRGAVAAGRDGVPDKSITSFIKVVQGSKEFKEETDFKKTGDTIDWSPVGDEPAPESTYKVTYRYRAPITADKVTAQEITVSDGADNGDIIVSYTYKLPRIDRIGLNAGGDVVYIKGISADQPMAPSVPDDVLSLATIRNNWLEMPLVVNDGTRVAPYDEIWRYFQRVLSLDRLMQLERIKSNVDSKEPVAKKGMFADPFLDDSYRDEGFKQTGAVGNGILQLAIDPTFYTAPLKAPVTLDWTNEVIIAQELTTACEKINPYQNFSPLPGTVTLTPATDFWHEQRTDWLSSVTNQLNMGKNRGRSIRKTEISDDLVHATQEQIDFLRQITLNFKIEGFAKGETLESLTFDGVNVLPNSHLVADAKGMLEGTFTIPKNITAGTKNVIAQGKGGAIATGLFTGQGVIDVKVMRRTTTVKIWTKVDPQAQVFTPDETRQITEIDFHLCKIGNPSHDLMIDLVTTENGYPTSDIQAQTSYPMKDAKTGWAKARYDVPLLIPDDRLTAFVIKTDDGDHSVSLAKLGDFDAENQRYVSSHPYVTGPRFSSVNAQSWTAHQDEALAFRVLAARYTKTEKTVLLGEFDLVDCSDLQIRAAIELPSSQCSVIFEIERNNGTIYQLLPFQLLNLTEYISEKVILRAILKGTEKLSPVLFAPVQLIAGKIHKEATYITRAFAFGEKSRLTSYIKTFLPGGSSFTLEMQLDDGAFSPLELNETEQLSEPLWTECKFISDDKSAQQARLKRASNSHSLVDLQHDLWCVISALAYYNGRTDMTKTKKLDMELPKEGRFISSEFPILRENLTKIDQAIADVEEKIDEKAPLKHTHSIGDVTDLEATLKGKMAADKTFSFADLSDIEGAQDAANNYVLYKSSNNHFTFGSTISLLGMHQHKTEDIVGLDDFRTKINEDLTAYGRLAQANEWQNDNKFNNKVTMNGDVELTGNSSLNLTHNGEVVTSLSTTESKLKGPLKVDGEAVYTKSEIDKLMALFTKKPVEILMTESGTIPLPEGVTDDTEIEIWAWGAGGGGAKDGGGGGGQCVRVKIKGSDLKKSQTAKIGRGGKGNSSNILCNGGKTTIEQVLSAEGGYSISMHGVMANGKGGDGGAGKGGASGESFIFSGGNGGGSGIDGRSPAGSGGSSFFGGGGGGGAQGKGSLIGQGGESCKGGKGGNGSKGYGGGGGGHFGGKPGSDKVGGDGGDGAILLKFFI